MQRAISKMVDYLAKQGDRIIKEAARTAATTERTGNQGDAYGWAVYYDGILKKMGFWTPTPAAHEKHRGYKDIPDGTGRQWVVDYFRNNFTPADKGFALVCVNAAYYTVPLEKGTYSKGDAPKYRVISQIFGDMETLATKLKGTTRLLNKDVK